MSFGHATATGRRPGLLLAALLALVLALSAGPPPAPAATGPDAFVAGAVCHAAGEPSHDGGPAVAHDCCLVCHLLALSAPDVRGLGPPPAAVARVVLPLAGQVPPRPGNGGAWSSRAPPA